MSFEDSKPCSTAMNAESQKFCDEFCHDPSIPKYILGRNIYAESVAKNVLVNGFIDDFTNDPVYLGLPVLRLGEVPKDSIVLNVSGGRPLSARRRLEEAGLRNLDYFAFHELSGLPLAEMRFNEGFKAEFSGNKDKYDWVKSLLKDEESQVVFEKLIRFRLEYDIAHLEGFTQREDVQYFEDFLHLQPDGETFIDVGAFDGYTTLEFIKRCPGYKSVHAFEPDQNNFRICSEALAKFQNIHCHQFGLSRSKATLQFNGQGSCSKVTDDGLVSILVDRLDDVLHEAPTFIKMDIEGEERAAIEGARNTILSYHPRLAISVYHAPGEFWRIPQQILAIRDDYDIYMRHYTECIYETVMFFMPKN